MDNQEKGVIAVSKGKDGLAGVLTATPMGRPKQKAGE